MWPYCRYHLRSSQGRYVRIINRMKLKYIKSETVTNAMTITPSLFKTRQLLEILLAVKEMLRHKLYIKQARCFKWALCSVWTSFQRHAVADTRASETHWEGRYRSNHTHPQTKLTCLSCVTIFKPALTWKREKTRALTHYNSSLLSNEAPQ